MRRKNLRDTTNNPMTVQLKASDETVEDIQKNQQQISELYEQREEAKGFRQSATDFNKAQPIATAAKDTFDDINLKMAKTGYRMPEDYVSVFKGGVTREKQAKLQTQFQVLAGAPVGCYKPRF